VTPEPVVGDAVLRVSKKIDPSTGNPSGKYVNSRNKNTTELMPHQRKVVSLCGYDAASVVN